MQIKITSKKEIINKSETTSFFINELKVASCSKSQEFFCTVKNGKRSIYRDKIKYAYRTHWDHNNLKIILKENFDPEKFKNDYPDLTWGYQGSILTKKKVKELIGGLK